MVWFRQVFKALMVALTIVFGLSLAEEQRELYQGELPDWTRLQPVNEEYTGRFVELIEREANCMFNELTAPGQALHASGSALHASGSVGGFARYPGYVNTVTFPFFVNNPDLSNPDLAAMPADQHFPSTAILVLDEFNDIYTVDVVEVRNALTPIDNWPQNATLVAARVKDLKQHALSHGALVMDHINALILGTRHYTRKEDPADPSTIEWMHNNGETIVVRAVELAIPNERTVNTEEIAGGLQRAIGKIWDDYQVDLLIINMSFVLIPCAILEDYLDTFVEGETPPTFDEYTLQLKNRNAPELGDDAFVAFQEMITTPFGAIDGNEPLNAMIDEYQGSVTFVASSGNLNNRAGRYTYPMYPAAWENVVAVSARAKGDQYGTVDFANPGQVVATGAWFTLSDWRQAANSGLQQAVHPVEIVYAGTSFSAPSVTVAIAMFETCDLLYFSKTENMQFEPALSNYCQ